MGGSLPRAAHPFVCTTDLRAAMILHSGGNLRRGGSDSRAAEEVQCGSEPERRSRAASRKSGELEIASHGGIVLVVLPTVIFGGVSILSLLIDNDEYMANSLRQDLWRAGHAHAGCC